MVIISKPLSASRVQSYYQNDFTSKEQNHWSQRDVISGEWQGRLAKQLGLSRTVTAEDFQKLSEGQHPRTGQQLVRRRASFEYRNTQGKKVKTIGHRAGVDVTFSAPKSVSLTALVGGDDRVREAHRASVSTALGQLETYTQAYVSGNHRRETTGKFIAARFEHDTSRPVNGYAAPHLHTHAVLFNLTGQENGQARPIDNWSLLMSAPFATAVYRSDLTYRLKDLGYEITVGRSGAPEIKGYTQEYLDASSPRTRQIREHLALTGQNGRRTAAVIAGHKTRDRKEIRSPGEMMAAHHKLAADFGHQADAVVRAARDREQHQQRLRNTVDRARQLLTYSRDKNFERHDIVDERALLTEGLNRGMGDITLVQIRADLNARIASGEFLTVERAHIPSRQLITAKTIAVQQEIVCRVWDGRNHVQPLLPRPQAIEFSDRQQHLSRIQRTVVEDVLSTPDRIQAIQGFAGPKRTTSLSLIRSVAETHGYKVAGLAQTSSAARQLGEAGVEIGRLEGFLAPSSTPISPTQKHFYFVDESSLSSAHQMRDFLFRIAPQDRVLMIGAPGPLQGVRGVQDFDQLQEAGMRTARLDENVQQKELAVKSAVQLLARGQVSAALDALQKEGLVTEIRNTEGRIRAIARSYADSPERTLIVSPDNASLRALNATVRQELKANGTVAPEGHRFRVLVERQELTGAERSRASHYQINDVVRYTRGSKTLGIVGGEYGKVVGINPASNLLAVERSTGDLANYDPRRLTCVSVYREVVREFSVGDRIRFTFPDSTMRVSKRDFAVIESIAPDGVIAARLDTNRRVQFDISVHRHLDHGYVVTSPSLQKLTARRVLMDADTGVHPGLFNSRFGYGSLSRSSHEVTIFTDNMTKLTPQLNRDDLKSSALQIQPASLVQGIGMEML
jgi:conjugative relaxase-like TrwC/TraI family protein